jgi:N-acyl homoserine lactone hydrolase
MVLAFDAADLMENLERELPIGGVVDIEPEATAVHIRRLKSLAHERGYLLVLWHDPHVWPNSLSS